MTVPNKEWAVYERLMRQKQDGLPVSDEELEAARMEAVASTADDPEPDEDELLEE